MGHIVLTPMIRGSRNSFESPEPLIKELNLVK